MCLDENRYRRELILSVARKWRRATAHRVPLTLDADEVADLEALGVGNAIAHRLAEYCGARSRAVVDPETLGVVKAADAAFFRLLRLGEFEHRLSAWGAGWRFEDGDDAPWPDGPDAA